MTSRDLTQSDFVGLELQAQRNRFAGCMFADLEHPCSPKESFWMTAGAFLLGCVPVLIVLAFILS